MTKIKALLKIIVMLCLALSMSLFSASCSGDDCTEHKDADGNGKCDVCDAAVEIEECTSHSDTNGDGKCDVCDSDLSDGKTKYTVILKDESGAPISGVVLRIGEKPENETDVTTDANGKAEYSIKSTGRLVFVEFVDMGADYEEPADDVEFASGEYEITVTLKKLESYTVRVVDSKGNAVSGISVKLCQGETCLTPKDTDSDGNAVFRFVPNGAELKAMVNSAPDKYSYKTEYDYFVSGEKSITLTVTEKTRVTVTVKTADGVAVAGATVKYILGTDTVAEYLTDENGNVAFDASFGATAVKVWLTALPSGYSFGDTVKLVTVTEDAPAVNYVVVAE